MFPHKKFNIFDFDIYSRRISFFYNSREKIGSFLGFILTVLYIISTIVLFFIYSINTIRRSDVRIHDSSYNRQDMPSFNINPNILYLAFGLENTSSLNRYIDETIYYPEILLITKGKENGTLITKEKINIKPERCDVRKFGEKYQNLFVEDELNNSYCFEDYNFTLEGGFKYDKFSYIRITIQPCVNTTENNYHCKPQEVIDTNLNSAYFSMIIKDIGLNPLNYTTPVIPILQNLYTTVGKTIMRDFLIYFGITEIQTDIGLITNNIYKDPYLQFREYNDRFFLRDEKEYYSGKSILAVQIRLEEVIKIQRRTYTKFAEIFSIIGGYMQLIYSIFNLLTLITKNINVEKKLLNSLFNFNISKKKIILSIRYEKRLKYLIHLEKGEINSFIPFIAKKSLRPYKKYNKKFNHNLNNNNKIILNKNNSFAPLIQKSVTESMKIKNNDNIKKKNYSDKLIFRFNKISMQNKKKKKKFYANEQNMSRSKNEKVSFDSQNKNVIIKNNKKNNPDYIKKFSFNINNQDLDESISDLNFNALDYLCNFRRIKKNKAKTELFNSGVTIYRNQMNIIHIFNIIFLTEILLNQQYNKKINILNQTIEIPIK